MELKMSTLTKNERALATAYIADGNTRVNIFKE